MATVIALESLRRMSSEDLMGLLSAEGILNFGYRAESRTYKITKPSVLDVSSLQKPKAILLRPTEEGWYSFRGECTCEWAKIKGEWEEILYVGYKTPRAPSTRLSVLNWMGYESLTLKWFEGEFCRIYPHWEEEPYVSVPDAVEQYGDGEAIIEF